ncbi:hypothetical protein CLV59_105500 [Chitinophaga dinghuensis]|uniref:Uncharacterized protein n=1 Tax=Chitinophaga dinghuensis TaxID=1539050 RepID=A0A327VWL0_9BACT|nr:hypothetical protein [Chitinophaga dinghuensis]RAJ80391.1 hypothetical protein CLV59_105500 [Chitinophaga dinghuensis]
MKRPVSVPENAIYNETDKEWLFGATNENNQRIGPWKVWHIEGYLWGTIEYGDGTPPYPTLRFHPDGTISQKGEWYGGDKYLGPLRLIRSVHPTPEYFPPNNADNVWIAEFDYTDEFTFIAQRYFDIDNTAVSSDGDPLPTRPEKVPARAHFVRLPYSATNWIMGTVDTRTGDYIDEYFEWDLDGNPVVKRLYSNTGKVLEDYRYDSGALTSSYLYDKDDPTDYENTYYYSGMPTPVPKTRMVYRHKKKDVTNIYFDKTGQQLYAVRREELSPVHKRRYYNGKLLCEAHLSADDDQFPESVVYYSPGGYKCIDLTNNNDGTGTWRLYNAEGHVLRQFTVHENEDDHYELIRWDAFLPSWGSYDAKTTSTDWETVVKFFNQEYDELNAKQQLYSLEIPSYLQKELDSIDWETIDAYHSGGGAELPIGINGMLSEDNTVANIAFKMLWAEITQQGSVFESTYKTAVILAHMVPHYSHLSTVQIRLGRFLYSILDQYEIRDHEHLYKELTEAITPLEPTLLQWGINEDIDIAHMAQYILIYTGTEATEQYLLQEWHNTDYSSTRRGYALFSLADFYAIRDQSHQILSIFPPTFMQETDPFVRFVMAAQLVLLTHTAAREEWLAELLHALANQEALDEDYINMTPFIGNIDNIHEYILVVLGKSRPDILEKMIAPIIDELPNMYALKQVSYLRTILDLLFNDETSLDDITPIRKKALLAAADATAKNPGLVNLIEIFRAYNLPHEAYALRQLAEA